MHLDEIPRERIARLPTPLEPLPRLSEALGGPRIWVKRDDLTGLAFGGNKVRKLEFFLAEALEQRADTLVTTGFVQSNHARQTAAAAAKYGMRAALLLIGDPPPHETGNLLLDRLLGAEVLWTPSAEGRDRELDALMDRLHADGARPYLVPHGGSNELGALGYIFAMAELADQLKAEAVEMDAVVTATSSGGTQSGLVMGAALFAFNSEIVGISVGPERDVVRARLSAITSAARDRWDLPVEANAQQFEVHDDYVDGGYGILTDLERGAIHLAARHEGLMLDPVYTGRAMGGLIDLIRRERFTSDQTVLFWHTGGTPALFAYSDRLAPPGSDLW